MGSIKIAALVENAVACAKLAGSSAGQTLALALTPTLTLTLIVALTLIFL